jgi:WD40 repeat protein
VPPLAFTQDNSLPAIAWSANTVRLVKPATGEEVATLTTPDPRPLTWLAFSRDGTQLAAATENQVVQLWDLRLLRDQLKTLNLDWDLSDYPAPDPADQGVPARVQVLLRIPDVTP